MVLPVVNINPGFSNNQVMYKYIHETCPNVCEIHLQLSYGKMQPLLSGGHFVCKLFDIFTPFSVGLVYLMYRVFRRVSIFKPVTSRPANSER